MKIELHEIKIREVVNGFIDSAENGVVGYDGKLNIRPAFQREFIYKDKQRDEVINTVRKNFPLNVMYWVKSDDGNFELLDGQQRTLSICQYVNGDFSLNFQYFHNLTHEEQEQILEYPLMIYICEGTDREKLEWFQIINIAGEELADQELRNAIYTGEWLTAAKRYFSKSQCPAYQIADKYLSGSAIRQDYLETALKWISNRDGIQIEEYMAAHQHDPNANELWTYFKNVIDWIGLTFTNKRKEMKGLDWGGLYDAFHTQMFDTVVLENEIKKLMMDDDVTNKKGIYPYVLNRNEKHLNIRAFTPSQKREAYERQSGICPICHKQFVIDEMEADHITPWSQGGKTNADNCQMLCKDCNRHKSDN